MKPADSFYLTNRQYGYLYGPTTGDKVSAQASFLEHTGKCIRRFAGIYAYCRYFIDRKW